VCARACVCVCVCVCVCASFDVLMIYKNNTFGYNQGYNLVRTKCYNQTSLCCSSRDDVTSFILYGHEIRARLGF